MPAWSQEDEQRLLQLLRTTNLTQREIAYKLEEGITAVAVWIDRRLNRHRALSSFEELTIPLF